jgi:hypothetical protein
LIIIENKFLSGLTGDFIKSRRDEGFIKSYLTTSERRNAKTKE